MTLEQWEEASEEERDAEYERCKDPAYFYNTYWKREGMPEYSKEDFDRMKEEALIRITTFKPRTYYNPLTYPLTYEDAIPTAHKRRPRKRKG